MNFMNLFKLIENQKGENLSTEILGFLLSKKAGSEKFQKYFVKSTIDIDLTSSDLLIEYYTQITFKDKSRPDLLIFTNKDIIILENKLGSYLSTDDQLIRYSKISVDELKSRFSMYPEINIQSFIGNIYLVFLAPKHIAEKCEIDTANFLKIEKNNLSEHFRKSSKIKYRKVYWEDIRENLCDNNPIELEFKDFLNIYLEDNITEMDIEILSNKNTPNSIIKIFNRIYQIQDGIDAPGITIYRRSQSLYSYGTYFSGNGYNFWFGYNLNLWEKYQTPVFLQLHTNKNTISDDVLNYLKINFKIEQKENYNYVMAFTLPNIENWLNILNIILKELPPIN